LTSHSAFGRREGSRPPLAGLAELMKAPLNRPGFTGDKMV